MNVISIEDRRQNNHSRKCGVTKETTAMPTESILERLERYSILEIGYLKLDSEAQHKLKEAINAIENELDKSLSTILRETKNRRSKAARAEAEAAIEQHKIAVRKLGLSIHEATNSLNTMRLVCHRVSDRHPESSNARRNIIEAAWNGVGRWIA